MKNKLLQMMIESMQSRLAHAMLGSCAMLLALAIPSTARPRPDFNHDGAADLAIGVSGENLNGQDDVGFVHVVCGRRGPGLGNVNQKIHAGNIQLAAGLSGNQAGLQFGRVLSWGDFNGDGFDDLVVGMPGYDAGPWVNSGLVYVLYGGPSNANYPCGVRTTNVHAFLSTNLDPINVNLDINDFFGAALAAGDFNHDGFDDLAIGAPGQDGWDGVAAILDAGEVYVIYGSPAGLNRLNTQGWSQNGTLVWPDIAGVPQANDRFGFALAAGDFNNDGFADLAIGVPGEGNGGGAVNVIYGSPLGLNPGLGALNQLWTENSPGVAGIAAANKLFGYALAAGDFNHDGRADLAISAPNATAAGVDPGLFPIREFSGEVVIIYGSQGNGLDPVRDLTGGGSQLFDQNTAGIVNDGYLRGDKFGYSLAAGDFNGDGTLDLAIGKPGDDPGDFQGQTVDSSGSVTILFGLPGVWGGLTAALSQYWHQATGGVPGVIGDNEAFGRSLFAADFDGNGRDDLAIGVPGDSINGVRCGAVNVLYFGAGAPPHQILEQNFLGVLPGFGPCQAGDRFGVVSTDWN